MRVVIDLILLEGRDGLEGSTVSVVELDVGIEDW